MLCVSVCLLVFGGDGCCIGTETNEFRFNNRSIDGLIDHHHSLKVIFHLLFRLFLVIIIILLSLTLNVVL